MPRCSSGKESLSRCRTIRGWSLLEMVVALSVLMVVLAAIFGVLIPMIKAFDRQQVQHELFMQTNQALQALNRTVSGSFGWIEGDSLSIRTVSQKGDTMTIGLKGPAGDLCINGRPILPAGFKTAGFLVIYKPMNDSAMAMNPNQGFVGSDQNHDGMITGTEISRVASLELRLTSAKAGEIFAGSTYPTIPPAVVGIVIGQ